MDYVVNNIKCLDLAETLDCGQAFRWKDIGGGNWQGVAFNKQLTVSIDNGNLIFHNTSEDDFNKYWKNYFDLRRDYTQIEQTLKSDPTLYKMFNLCNGVRVLNQEPWETLCSFIISQNNNIKRIKGIIERLCEMFGEKTENSYTFPSAEIISKCTLDDLAPLRTGFRAKYILDAAKKVARGEVNLEAVKSMPTPLARAELMKIYGVGEKVADCVLLFGMGHSDAFPKDVWIKRAMPLLFPNGLPQGTDEIAGIIQQYIFSYARKTKLDI